MAGHEYYVQMYRDGRFIDWLHPTNISISRAVNDVGYCALTFPRFSTITTLGENEIGQERYLPIASNHLDYWTIDNLIIVWRRPWLPLQPAKLEFCGFIRKRAEFETPDGEFFGLGCFDLKYLLSGRDIINQLTQEGSTGYTIMTDYLDDMMKAIVIDQMGSDAATARQWPYFSVAPDVGAVASYTFNAGHGNVLAILQDIADTAAVYGTDLFFDVVYKNPTSFEFRTFVNQPGTDCTIGNKSQFADWWGNIANPIMEEDYSDEYNTVYAWGAGVPGNQDLETLSDTQLLNRSIWARREYSFNAGNLRTGEGLGNAGRAELRQGRPTLAFTCDLLDNYEGSVYGVHWGFGDKVGVIFNSKRYEGIVKGVDIEYKAQTTYQAESEKLRARFVYDDIISGGG